MMLSALATLLLALIAMAPGTLFCRRLPLDTGLFAALATASLAICLMATALLSVAVHFVSGQALAAWALAPVSLVLCGIASWHTRGAGWRRPSIEWPGLAIVALFLLYGVFTYAISITDLPDGSLRVHSWYNADWFKHIGHSFALADYGIPARDIFAGGRPLNYYWLIYLLPGAGTSIGGDAWSAFYVANLILAALLWLTFYGLVRSIGVPPIIAALAVLIATLATAPAELWIVLLKWDAKTLIDGPYIPIGPSFISFQLYIPQHAFALALFLGWAGTTIRLREQPAALRLVILGGLATVMTVSTLFGGILLGTYCLFALDRRGLAALPELAILGVLAGLFVLVLGVIDLGHADAAMKSPALTNPPDPGTAWTRAYTALKFLFHGTGLAFLLSLFLAVRWRPRDEAERDGRSLAILLALVTVGATIALEFLFRPRIAQEIGIRVLNLPTVTGALVAGTYLWHARSSGRDLRGGIAISVLLVGLAIPSLALLTAWHGSPARNFTTVIPADDRTVLSELRAQSGAKDIVWQYPEKPFLSRPAGRDAWAVIFAGRTVLASERATDYPAALPDIAAAYRYFSGAPEHPPASADWVYLSRTLHPDTYDQIAAQLSADRHWKRRLCLQNACLFSRVEREATR
ncbi:MAG: hypothetical protein J7496_00060 [Novosphingobium sp.]|nr:hypothetical protein [Novosphingobium sp.]